MTYARKVDANQPQIVAAFEKLGCRVFDSSGLGRGFPDLVVQRGKVTILVEVKTPTGRPTRAQAALAAQGWSVTICRTPSDVLEASSYLRRSAAKIKE